MAVGQSGLQDRPLSGFPRVDQQRLHFGHCVQTGEWDHANTNSAINQACSDPKPESVTTPATEKTNNWVASEKFYFVRYCFSLPKEIIGNLEVKAMVLKIAGLALDCGGIVDPFCPSQVQAQTVPAVTHGQPR